MRSIIPSISGFRFQMYGRTVVSLVFAGMLLGGCRELGLIKGTAHDLTARYRSELSLWTQQTEIYYNFELILSLAATYQSEPFRTAYVEEYARVYELKEVERDKRLSGQLKAAELAYEFLFAVHVPVDKWDDFDTEASMWRIFLEINDDERINPEELVKLKGNDAVIRYFYPYISPWKSIYRVRFAKPAINIRGDAENIISNRIKLVVTGAKGRAELNWAVAAPNAG